MPEQPIHTEQGIIKHMVATALERVRSESNASTPPTSLAELAKKSGMGDNLYPPLEAWAKRLMELRLMQIAGIETPHETLTDAAREPAQQKIGVLTGERGIDLETTMTKITEVMDEAMAEATPKLGLRARAFTADASRGGHSGWKSY